MKLNFIFLICLVFSLFEKTEIKAQNKNVANSLLFAQSQEYTWIFYEETGRYYRTNYEQFNHELLDILKGEKTPNVNQCAAVYYLGKMRVAEAAKILAERIDLQLDLTRPIIEKHWVVCEIKKYPAVEALIEIGNPSISAVIRNLAESDDVKVRELSFKVLYHIEGDKDIVQLRLQKALTAEKDLQKQARLQSALKALAETSFEN
jgi:hypothetical protein